MRKNPARNAALLILCALVPLAGCQKLASLLPQKDLKKSVVKVFTTVQNVDFYEPWKPGAQAQLEGCGVVIPGNRILTTAHFADKANYIEVQKFGDAKRYVAKVEQVGYDLDLALLSLEDKDFFKDAQPVRFGDLPAPGDKVLVHGGDEISVKEDNISGLDMVYSTEAMRYVPGLITYNPIDPKKDGCPVFSQGKFVGITFESWHVPDKTGTLIPVNVIQRFLEGLKDGRPYGGFPDIGVYVQNLQNPALQAYDRLPADKTGVVVTKVVYGGSADGILREGDLLTAIDDQPIDDEGDITLAKSARIDWTYLITFYPMGGRPTLDVIRNGMPLKVQVPLKPISKLVAFRPDNIHPTYFMFAGFVFVPLTVNYFGSGDWEGFKPELKDLFFHGFPSAERRQVVLLSHVLPNEINVGYDKQTNLILDKVNGRPVGDMKELLAAFAAPQGPYHVIELQDHAWFGSKIVIDAAKAPQATAQIMADFKIPADRSRDLK